MLFSILKEKGVFATATIRENRTNNCPLESVKSMSKKNRGVHDVQFDESTNISVVRWNDNSIVTMISTHYGAEPLKSAKRFNKKQKKMENVPQPSVIYRYNRHMGGVDLHDNGVANTEQGSWEKNGGGLCSLTALTASWSILGRYLGLQIKVKCLS